MNRALAVRVVRHWHSKDILYSVKGPSSSSSSPEYCRRYYEDWRFDMGNDAAVPEARVVEQK